MDKKTVSIICEKCGGWHPTAAHEQHEQQSHEKHRAEIQARPDSAYHFDTLGFTPERKGEIEPWMHTIIERAKELGDDLQDSDFYLHTGPLEAQYSKVEDTLYPSTLSFLQQKSFQETAHPSRFRPETLYVSPHNPGEEIETFWAKTSDDIKTLLDLQERFVKTRQDDDLVAYQQAIKDKLNKIIEDITLLQSVDNPFYQRYKEEAKDLKEKLDTTDGRKKAVKLILRGPSGESVGIIFKLGDGLKKKFKCRTLKVFDVVDWFSMSPEGVAKERIVRIIHQSPPDFSILASQVSDLEAARSFFTMFLHGLYLPHGSIEEQQEVLRRMLEMTKDDPERRLPIYNFYGKLVWPRPPEGKT